MIGATARTETMLSEAHRRLLDERGISPETAARAGLRSTSAAEAKKILGFDPKSSGILIPYTHPNTNAVRTYRFRPDVPLTIDGKAAKYLSPRGVGNLLYFPPEAGTHLQNIVEPVIITEGEFKTLAAYQVGLLCVGLTGVWGWKAKKSTGGSAPIADLDFLASRGRSFTIIYDSDLILNAQVAAARHALGKELYRRDAYAVMAIELPADGSKVGLDDFLVSQGVEALFNLEVAELPATDIPPFLSPISVILDSPEEPLEWAIEGIQPMGASGWRIASPKVGKSFDMLEEAYCLATGESVYGHFRVPQKRRVCIIEEEDPRRRLKHRLERIIHAHGGVRPSDEFFKASVKKGFRLDLDPWREVLEYEVKTWRPEIVYLDVFSRLHAQDMNDGKAMSEIVLFLDNLNRDYGAAFILLHHDRKVCQGKADFNDIMGSRVLGGFADATMFLAKTKEKGVLRVQVSLKDEPEDGSFEPEFMIRLRDTENGRGTFFEYLGSPPERQAESDLRKLVKNYLDVSGDWRTVKEVADAIHASKPTARETLNVMVDLRIAEKEQRGQAYVYRSKPETPESAEGFQ